MKKQKWTAGETAMVVRKPSENGKCVINGRIGKGGVSVTYVGDDPKGDIEKAGEGAKPTFLLILVGIVLLGGAVASYFVIRDNNKSKNKQKEQNNETEAEIKKGHEATKDAKDLQDNETKNAIEKAKAESQIRREDLKFKKSLANKQKEAPVPPKERMTLREWIDAFHSSFTMPDYSAFSIISPVLNGCPAGFEEAMLFHLLSMTSALCFSRVRACYIDNKMHSPNLQVIVEGERGSGKDKFTTVYKTLFDRVIQSDLKKMSTDSPDDIIQTRGINVSESKFYEILARNRQVHIFAYEPEITTAIETFHKKGRPSSTILKYAFDNDYISRDNNDQNAVKGAWPVFFNMTFTGTPGAANSFFSSKEEEGGTARRMCFSAIPDLDIIIPTLNLPIGTELEAIRDYIDECREKFCYKSIDKGHDEPCPEHVLDLDYINTALNDWVIDQGIEAKKNGDAFRNGVRSGIGAIAFHCAMVLHMLAGEPDSSKPEKRRAVKDMTIYIANYCIERYIYKFTPVAKPKKETYPPRTVSLDEIAEWYLKRGTFDESGNEIGLGYIARELKTDKNSVKNAWNRYEKSMSGGKI